MVVVDFAGSKGGIVGHQRYSLRGRCRFTALSRQKKNEISNCADHGKGLGWASVLCPLLVAAPAMTSAFCFGYPLLLLVRWHMGRAILRVATRSRCGHLALAALFCASPTFRCPCLSLAVSLLTFLADCGVDAHLLFFSVSRPYLYGTRPLTYKDDPASA